MPTLRPILYRYSFSNDPPPFDNRCACVMEYGVCVCGHNAKPKWVVWRCPLRNRDQKDRNEPCALVQRYYHSEDALPNRHIRADFCCSESCCATARQRLNAQNDETDRAFQRAQRNIVLENPPDRREQMARLREDWANAEDQFHRNIGWHYGCSARRDRFLTTPEG